MTDLDIFRSKLDGANPDLTPSTFIPDILFFFCLKEGFNSQIKTTERKLRYKACKMTGLCLSFEILDDVADFINFNNGLLNEL